MRPIIALAFGMVLAGSTLAAELPRECTDPTPAEKARVFWQIQCENFRNADEWKTRAKDVGAELKDAAVRKNHEISVYFWQQWRALGEYLDRQTKAAKEFIGPQLRAAGESARKGLRATDDYLKDLLQKR